MSIANKTLIKSFIFIQYGAYKGTRSSNFICLIDK
nr:MAG TPA: hypothetical protein [Caudoviricetes sp.]